MEWQPVAWNSGTDSKNEGCVLSSGSNSDDPNRLAPREFTKKRLIKLVIMLRWVPTAPFGRPVVPEV